MPFHTAGNLGGLFTSLGSDERYFRIVNMDDPSFQRRSVSFQVDGEFVDAFDDIINFVTVNFRKKYGAGHDDVTSQLIINGSDLKKGVTLKEISYPRLGISGSEWLDYEYQLLWSFKGSSKVVRYPADPAQWIRKSDPAVQLIPPLAKEYIEVDGDRQLFAKDNIASVSISFASTQGGERKVVRNLILRTGDASSTSKIAVYHDPGTQVVYQPAWYHPSLGEAKTGIVLLNSNYVYLQPPAPDQFKK